MEYPIFNTKQFGSNKSYDFNNKADQKKYFEDKCAVQIEDIKTYVDEKGFLAIWLSKKSAGKGTRSKMVADVIGHDRVTHISVGDIVRDIHSLLENNDGRKKEIMGYLRNNYRGMMSLDEAIEAFVNKTQAKLIPTEFILTLVKMEIEKAEGKAIFLDGFPRSLDQIAYSLYFREIMNLAVGPDFFVLIDVPESVIDERMKTRRICPKCNTSRSINLLPSSIVKYKKETDEYVLVCDNKECVGYGKDEMVEKEGDSDGIDPIRKRLEAEGELLDMAKSLHGVEKVYLRNAIPVTDWEGYVSDYEVTPEFYYEGGKEGEKVSVKTRPWVVKDDNGVDSISLMVQPHIVSLIHQIHSILITGKNKYETSK
jgi:adenylate kinase family enzyme